MSFEGALVMAKKVLLVGHCGPDTSYLKLAVKHADPSLQILAADDAGELSGALAEGVDLILFNRELDYGFDERQGVDLIRKVKTAYPAVRSMLVSNYPDAQAAALAAGAAPGFGKRDIGSPKVSQAIRDALK
jgi:DNA-binding NarL/FixJ family response regulator